MIFIQIQPDQICPWAQINNSSKTVENSPISQKLVEKWLKMVKKWLKMVKKWSKRGHIDQNCWKVVKECNTVMVENGQNQLRRSKMVKS
jgi:hypothetical protein